MEPIKINFFSRVKKAIVDFESYADFAIEKLSVAIKYYAKLAIICSIILSIVLSVKISQIINDEEQLQIMYNQVQVSGISEEQIKEAANTLKSNQSFGVYAEITVILIPYTFMVYIIMGIYGSFLVALMGLVFSRLFRLILKFKPIYIMSIYAITLSTLLATLYFSVYIFNQFTINNFDLLYTAISYIYIVTAILIIRSNFISHQQELMKIVMAQREVRKEVKNENPDDDEPENDKKDDKNDEKKENDNGIDSEPEV